MDERDNGNDTFKMEDIDKVLTRGDVFTFTTYDINYDNIVFHGVYLYAKSRGLYRVDGYRLLVVQCGSRNIHFEMKRSNDIVFLPRRNDGYMTTMRKT